MGTSPRDAIVPGSSLRPVAEARWAPRSSCHGSDLKDGTRLTCCGQGAGIWGPQGMAKADQALALHGLKPLPSWNELPASCFGVIYRAAIYIASISAAVWGRCEEARGEGLSLPQPRCPDVGCPVPAARDAVGGIGASLAAGRAWLGTRAGPSPALRASTLQKKTLRMIRSAALGCQDFLELALLVSAKKKVRGVGCSTVVGVTTCSSATGLSQTRTGSCLATSHLVTHRGSPSSHDGGSSCQNCHLLPLPRSPP